MAKAKAKYTFYLVSRSADDHRPVLVARNGKQPLNESVKRAVSLKASVRNLLSAIRLHEFDVVSITHKEFKKLHPKPVKNSGPKKAK